MIKLSRKRWPHDRRIKPSNKIGNFASALFAHQPHSHLGYYTMKKTTELIAAIAGVLIASSTMIAATEAIALHHTEQAPLSRPILALRTIAFLKTARPNPLRNMPKHLRFVRSIDDDEQ
jgi:hypothetical protein